MPSRQTKPDAFLCSLNKGSAWIRRKTQRARLVVAGEYRSSLQSEATSNGSAKEFVSWVSWELERPTRSSGFLSTEEREGHGMNLGNQVVSGSVLSSPCLLPDVQF